MAPTINKAEQSGYTSQRMGLSSNDNPFPKTNKKWEDWNRGYLEASQETDDEPDPHHNLHSFKIGVLPEDITKLISDEVHIAHNKVFVDEDLLFEPDEQLIIMAALGQRITETPWDKIRLLKIIKKILHAKKQIHE